MPPCRRVRRRGEQHRSVMARGNLDFLYGQVGVLVIGQRGLFSRHLLNAHRFEFLLESLAPPFQSSVLTRGGSAVQRREVNRRRQTLCDPHESGLDPLGAEWIECSPISRYITMYTLTQAQT